MMGLSYGEKNYEDMYNRLDRIPACDCDRRTDRQTDGRTRDCHCVRSLLFVYRISSKLVGSCVRPPPDGHNCYKCKKLQFTHKLTASDTSKTAKITKK